MGSRNAISRRTSSLGERIVIQRKAVRMTQAVLAQKIGVSRNTVANYENGSTEPGTTDLVRLAKELGCSVMSLLKENPDDSPPHFIFRAHKALGKNPDVMVIARKYFHAYREIEEITGTNFCASLSTCFLDPEQITEIKWIEMIAGNLRERFRIGDIGPENIVRSLEENGVRCIFFRTDIKGLDALSIRSGPMNLIMLRLRETGIERTIFSAAHELGHLVLHSGLYEGNEMSGKDERNYEAEADSFAGRFLVPSEHLLCMWNDERMKKLPVVHALLLLKKVFRVSFWCLYHRVKEEGLVNVEWSHLVNDVKRLLRIPPKEKAKMEELEPEPMVPELLYQSTRFSRLVRSAFLQQKIGVAKVAEMFQVTVDDAKEETAKWMEPEHGLVA